jgi:nuclear pore complex protein Nup188
LLSRPYAYPRPTPQSNASFGTRTASINAAARALGDGAGAVVEELKSDALWLSQKINIDEVSALRLVTLHWQRTQASRLSSGLSREEIASLQSASSQTFREIALVTSASNVYDHDPKQAHNKGSDLESRRWGIFQLFLSERISLLRVSNTLARIGLAPSSFEGEFKRESRRQGLHNWAWARRIGRTILNARMLEDDETEKSKNFLVECIDGLSDRVESLQQPCPWTTDFPEREATEALWQDSVVSEMVLVMSLMFLILEAKNTVTIASTIRAWFDFVQKNAFFSNFGTVSVALHSIIYY